MLALSADQLLMREHRLYQADFLMRKYRFSADEIPLGAGGDLSLTVDPKQAWADAHPEFFPVRLSRGSHDDLLRVPAIGPVYAKRIIETRRTGPVRSLREVGMKGKPLARAAGYVVVN